MNMKNVKKYLFNIIIYLVIFGAVYVIHGEKKFKQDDPLSPCDVKVSQDGKTLFIAEKTANQIAVLDISSKKIKKVIKTGAPPNGLALGKNHLYVTCSSPEGKLVIIDINKLSIIKEIATDHGSRAPVLSRDEKMIYICYQFIDEVGEIDLSKGKETRRIKVLRQPFAGVISKDGQYLFIANLLPAMRADIDYVASEVSVIDVKSWKKIKDLKLDNGSNALRGMCISKDGKYIYVTHNLGRFLVPTTQLERGWMNTSAISVIDVLEKKFVASILLDDVSNGAAGSWGSVVSDDNKYIYVAHSGTHEVSVIDQEKMLEKMNKYSKKNEISINLTFLYELRKRVKLEGNGPRMIAAHGNKVYAAEYFTDSVSIIEVKGMGEYDINVSSVKLNPELTMTIERKGEMYFNDARYCFQQWQSCTGCHPNDARVDGLNWDLMNDGLGNPKNCKSMLLAHKTPPAMITGIREKAEDAVASGFKFIQFTVVPEGHLKAVNAYLESLEPVPSPYLKKGKLSKSAERGKLAFKETGCLKCHNGPYYTDLKRYDMGEGKGLDKGKAFDTPTLIEVWRSGPYLYDGRARTIKDVIKEFKHGVKVNLTEQQIDDLTEYVLSL